MVDVSVIIVNYNTYDLTRSSIQSLRKHSQGCSYEAIVVDNGSEVDPSEKLSHEFSDLVMIRSEENLGFAAGNNLGIKRSKGKYILLLNSDTELLNDALETCTRFMDKNPKVGIVTGRLEYPDGTVQNNCQRFPGSRYAVAELLRIQKLLSKSQRGDLLLGSFFNYQKIVFPDWVWGTFFFFRSEILESLPGKKLNDEYFMYGEDMQWSWDIRKLGWQIAFLPEAKVMHIMSGSNGNKEDWMKESYSRFLTKNYNAFDRAFTHWIDNMLK